MNETVSFAKVAADPRGEIVALVERRGDRAPYEAVIHVFDARRSERLASFAGPKLASLRVAVRGDRVVVGDFSTGIVVGLGLAGEVAWPPLHFPRETLDSLGPGLDAETIAARVTEPGGVRCVLGIDPRTGTSTVDHTAVFANLPFGLGKMVSCTCWAEGVLVVSGWAEDATAPVGDAERKFNAMFDVAPSPRVPRLFGFVSTGGPTALLWQRDGHVLDLAPFVGGGVMALLSNEGLDEPVRERTPLLATSCLVRFDPATGADLARVDLGAALANVRDAVFCAGGTRLVATDGTIRDTTNGATVARLG